MIKDTVTGKHLPCRSGYSYSNTSVELTDDLPPRLFTTKGAATQAANCWKAGILLKKIDTPTTLIQTGKLTGNKTSSLFQAYGAGMEVYEVKGRELANLVVVPVDIIVET